MRLETFPKWGKLSPTRMGETWNPCILSPILLDTQPNNEYENSIPKDIKFYSFSFNHTGLEQFKTIKWKRDSDIWTFNFVNMTPANTDESKSGWYCSFGFGPG